MEKSWQTNPERLVQVLKVRESLRLLIKICLFDVRRKGTVRIAFKRTVWYCRKLNILKNVNINFLKIESNSAFSSWIRVYKIKLC